MKEAIIQYEDTPSGGLIATSWKPLVRCKDCKKRNISECPLHYGGHTENDTDDDWFCADGVAKDINVPNKEGWRGDGAVQSDRETDEGDLIIWKRYSQNCRT